MNRSERRRIEKRAKKDGKIPKSSVLLPTDNDAGFAIYDRIPMAISKPPQPPVTAMIPKPKTREEVSEVRSQLNPHVRLMKAQKSSACIRQDMNVFIDSLTEQTREICIAIGNKAVLGSDKMETAQQTGLAAIVLASEIGFNLNVAAADWNAIIEKHTAETNVTFFILLLIEDGRQTVDL